MQKIWEHPKGTTWFKMITIMEYVMQKIYLKNKNEICIVTHYLEEINKTIIFPSYHFKLFLDAMDMIGTDTIWFGDDKQAVIATNNNDYAMLMPNYFLDEIENKFEI